MASVTQEFQLQVAAPVDFSAWILTEDLFKNIATETGAPIAREDD